MKTRRLISLITACAIILFSVSSAEAVTGTLKVKFKYKDPATGAEQNLNNGFIYLHYAAKGPPMEKFLSKADYILGPSNYGDGVITRQVPEGSFYIRITQRKEAGGSSHPYGPPEEGDYTWMQPLPITISAGATLDLGTKYAYPFAFSPITITGKVMTKSGAPLVGRYVRAQTEPCIDYYDNNGNKCGPIKLLALEPTDESGRYTIQLRSPGTYYLYTSSSWSTQTDYGFPAIVGTPYPSYSSAPQPLTVKRGDKITADIVAY